MKTNAPVHLVHACAITWKVITLLVSFVAFVTAIRVTHAAERVPTLRLEQSLNAGSEHALARALGAATRDHAPALFIELETSRGVPEVAQRMADRMLSATLPIIVWVAPGVRVDASGTAVALAAHYLAMAPSSSLTNGGYPFLMNLAQRRGRDREWLKRAAVGDTLGAVEATEQTLSDGIAAARDQVWAAAHQKYASLPSEVEFSAQAPSLLEKIYLFAGNKTVVGSLLALSMVCLAVALRGRAIKILAPAGALGLVLSFMSVDYAPYALGARLHEGVHHVRNWLAV
ncbi:MAG: hypothetical protein JST16_18305 [Bdellovibrionales bacterium]|nr:hypothetical protein [Bdellovibrionales bacterium]